MSSYLMNGAVCGYGKISPGSYKAPQFRQDAIIFWQALETSSGDFTTVPVIPPRVLPKFIR